MGEIRTAQLLCRDQARADGNSVLAVGRSRARCPVGASDGGKLLLDARDRLRCLAPSNLLLVGIEAERHAEIGERLVVLALALIDLAPVAEGIQVLWVEPKRFVDLRQRALVIALLVVVVTKDVMDAGALRIEPESFIQVRQCAIDVTFAEVGGGASGIGAGDFRIELERLVVVGDGAVPVRLETYVDEATREVGLGELAAAQGFRRDQARAGRQRIVTIRLFARLHVISTGRRSQDAEEHYERRGECHQRSMHGLLPRKGDGRSPVTCNYRLVQETR